ncbi:hypothetical protein BCR36DRAFT_345228 [Piromyces finnis]|uniref:Sm domain-containing protein n=1 Tax=Piromyces finnis TaxID=1754191 RepID=A0A1Y1VIJ4_9FUNG|nr:hypothetical protein BCR36DRAFT_345228 [Piromyces finnis]|eukprot:ORX57227.1 hypothetical protein BCR36DRAFT_345228 [Piromyces finnis]
MAAKEVYCPKNDTENIKELSRYIYNKLRVTIEDKREFIGYFMCIDKDKNIILSATNEYCLKEETDKKDQNEIDNSDDFEFDENKMFEDKYESRFVGLIMIPGKYIKKVEAVSFPYI